MTYVLSHPENEPTKVQVRAFASPNAANDWRAKHLNLSTFAVDGVEDFKMVKDATLMALVNKNARVPVMRFSNRDAAIRAAFISLEVQAMPDEAKSVKKNPSAVELAKMKAEGKLDKPAKAPKVKAEPKVRERKPVAYEPKETVRAVRAGTKIAIMIDLLARKGGASLAEVGAALSATGKAVDPRAWLGYDLNKVAGYGAKENKEGNIVLVCPAGMTKPLPHTVKAEPKPKAVKEPKAAKAAKAEVVEAPAKPALKVEKGGKAAPAKGKKSA